MSETLPTVPHSSFRVGDFLPTMKVAVDRRGKYVAAYNDGNLLVWNVAEKRTTQLLRLRHVFANVAALTFDERGDLSVNGPSVANWLFVTHIYAAARDFSPPARVFKRMPPSEDFTVEWRTRPLGASGAIEKLCKRSVYLGSDSTSISAIETWDDKGLLHVIDANRALVWPPNKTIMLVTVDGAGATAESCLVEERDSNSWHYRVLSALFPARYPVWYSKKEYAEGGALADNGILQFVPSGSTIRLASKRPVFFNPENVNVVATLKDGDTVEIFVSPHYLANK